MDDRAAAFLEREGIQVDPDALYLLITSASGILLEDIGPLFGAIEKAYRRLLTLSVDKPTRDLLATRYRQGQPIHGVTRSINVRYEQFLIPREQEYRLSSREKRELARLKEVIPGLRELRPGVAWEPSRPYAPYRVELARSRIASPGFVELIGDPDTLTILLAFLMFLIRERRLNRHHRDQHLLAVRGDRRETIQLLLEMGYSRDELEAIAQYTEQELTDIFRELQQSRTRLAPGSQIDPTSDERQLRLGG